MELLNEAQKQAVTAGDGPLVIVAGPGTGKTKTLAERVRFLLKNGVPAPHILALTFTKKAAEEMRQRIGDVNVHTSTFHALCFELIRQKTGQTPQLITESVRLALLKKLPKPAALKDLTFRDISLRVSRVKNMADTDPAMAALTHLYNEQLAALKLVDFDDILVMARDFLVHDPNFRSKAAARFSHILVDEFSGYESPAI